MATVVYDVSGLPRVTLSRDDAGGFEAVIEIEGLDPERGTSADERGAGITALDPPTVEVPANRNAATAHRALLDGCVRAVAAACSSSPAFAELSDEQRGPGGLLLSGLRTTMAVRGALRQLGESI